VRNSVHQSPLSSAALWLYERACGEFVLRNGMWNINEFHNSPVNL
jgi:hypothetical protein